MKVLDTMIERRISELEEQIKRNEDCLAQCLSETQLLAVFRTKEEQRAQWRELKRLREEMSKDQREEEVWENE